MRRIINNGSRCERVAIGRHSESVLRLYYEVTLDVSMTGLLRLRYALRNC